MPWALSERFVLTDVRGRLRARVSGCELQYQLCERGLQLDVHLRLGLRDDVPHGRLQDPMRGRGRRMRHRLMPRRLPDELHGRGRLPFAELYGRVQPRM